MIKVLHTADWHIGQLFYEYDRTYEHEQFLHWLLGTLEQEQVDVLLISGDVFDLSNPSAVSVRLFYSFLHRATTANPDLQVVITAGNHDSASRLESPKPLLESSRIDIIGIVEKTAEGEIDYDRLLVPLSNKSGKTEAWCLAVPFLRMGDYPQVPDSDNPYAEGVAAFYEAAYQRALSKKQEGEAIIAMGHLHARQAEVGDMDHMERLIMGGVESIPASAFHPDIRYVALGHIHKAQRLGGNDHIRYSGSPLPMSFAEIRYKHQVVVFELEQDKASAPKTIEVPVSITLQRVPEAHSPLDRVLVALSQLEEREADRTKAPYLEVRVLLDGPEPGLRHKIETVLEGKYVRLAKIDVRYQSSSEAGKPTTVSAEQLHQLQPLDVLQKVYQSKYDQTVPEHLLSLFQQVTQEVGQNDQDS